MQSKSTAVVEPLSLEAVLHTLRRLQPEIREQFRAEVLGVFGSYARGMSHANSDIDLLVRFHEGASLLDLVGLGDYLETIFGRKVDILSERAIRPETRLSILNNLVRL